MPAATVEISCMVVTLPNFDAHGNGWGYSADTICDMITKVILDNCPVSSPSPPAGVSHGHANSGFTPM